MITPPNSSFKPIILSELLQTSTTLSTRSFFIMIQPFLLLSLPVPLLPCTLPLLLSIMFPTHTQYILHIPTFHQVYYLSALSCHGTHIQTSHLQFDLHILSSLLPLFLLPPTFPTSSCFTSMLPSSMSIRNPWCPVTGNGHC